LRKQKKVYKFLVNRPTGRVAFLVNMTDWNNRKKSAAALSIGSNTVLVLGKLMVGLAIGSVSVISEAVHSAMDLVAAIVAFFAVRESAKPPDKRHPFGHGKAEGLSGALEGILILAAIAIIVF